MTAERHLNQVARDYNLPPLKGSMSVSQYMDYSLTLMGVATGVINPKDVDRNALPKDEVRRSWWNLFR